MRCVQLKHKLESGGGRGRGRERERAVRFVSRRTTYAEKEFLLHVTTEIMHLSPTKLPQVYLEPCNCLPNQKASYQNHKFLEIWTTYC